MFNFVESYEDRIIDHLGNAGTSDFLIHVVQWRCACESDKDNSSIHMVIYSSGIMYEYYSHIGFLPIKHIEEGK